MQAARRKLRDDVLSAMRSRKSEVLKRMLETCERRSDIKKEKKYEKEYEKEWYLK